MVIEGKLSGDRWWQTWWLMGDKSGGRWWETWWFMGGMSDGGSY